jgi:hypothetical protein
MGVEAVDGRGDDSQPRAACGDASSNGRGRRGNAHDSHRCPCRSANGAGDVAQHGGDARAVSRGQG